MKAICCCKSEEESIYLEETWETTYGLVIEWEDGTIFKKHDVDSSKTIVEKLVSKLLHEQTDEEQVQYIIQDFLEQQYSCR